MRGTRQKSLEKQLARERMSLLLNFAKSVSASDAELARRYTWLARRIGMRTGVRFRPSEKRAVCKQCGITLIPGRNCRVRIRHEGSAQLTMTCLSCGAVKRYPSLMEKTSRGR